jgi:hypothetical protein
MASTTSSSSEGQTVHFPNNTSKTPGEEFEARQTATSDDYTPDPTKSLPLSPARQRLIDDIIALYSCEPTIERVKRYTADCVYDDQFVYANDRYKVSRLRIPKSLPLLTFSPDGWPMVRPPQALQSQQE